VVEGFREAPLHSVCRAPRVGETWASPQLTIAAFPESHTGPKINLERDFCENAGNLDKLLVPKPYGLVSSHWQPMSDIRPCVACFGNTEANLFPLLLILGRESNGTGSVVQAVGRYDFTESPGSAFWNRTYGLISRTCPEAVHLKRRCIKLIASPLIFANVSPQPIPSGVIPKGAIRARILPNIVEHLRQIFTLPIIERVRVVFLSVGPAIHFSSARDLVTSQCRSRNVHLVKLPYLGSRANNRIVDAAVSNADRVQVQRIISHFFASTNEG
jgi:hypothetical protein